MSRHVTIRTRHDDPEVIAAALRPDNTDEMETTVELLDAEGDGGDPASEKAGTAVLCTHIEREGTGGLHATVDDYVVNLTVADTVVQLTDRPTKPDDEPTESDSSADPTHNE